MGLLLEAVLSRILGLEHLKKNYFYFLFVCICVCAVGTDACRG